MDEMLTRQMSELLPDEVKRLIGGRTLQDFSMSPSARVFFIDRDRGYFLKLAAKGNLLTEQEMIRYFHAKHLSSEVLFYRSGDFDCMVTEKVQGAPLTDAYYLDRPELLAERLGETLRALHETDFTGCPVPNRMESYFQSVDVGYRMGRYDSSLFLFDHGGITFSSPKEAYAIASEGRRSLSANVLLHGDYCLPNVIFNQDTFSGFIDLGNGGVGDRHVDLFWGAWTLVFNLKTDRYTDRFFDAYGRDLVEYDKLKTVAAAETFG